MEHEFVDGIKWNGIPIPSGDIDFIARSQMIQSNLHKILHDNLINRFVLLVPESYDQYDILAPKSIETTDSKEQIEEKIKELSNTAVVKLNDGYAHWSDIVDFYGLNLQLICFATHVHKIDKYIFEPYSTLKIMTIDEWFALKNNY